jgi:cysteine desulfurase
LNVWFPGRPGHELQAGLGARGIAVACGSAATGACPSHVLLAMGLGEQRARESVRFSLGRATTARAVERTLEALGEVLERCPAAAGGVA